MGTIIEGLFLISLTPLLIFFIFKNFTISNDFFIIECSLYPILVFIFLINIPMIADIYYLVIAGNFHSDPWYQRGSFFLIFLIGTMSLGFISYCSVMKILNRNIGLIDIYIYTFLNLYLMLFIPEGSFFERKELYWYLFTIVFYVINIIYFYKFRKDKLLKIIIMPTVVSFICRYFAGVAAFLVLPWS